MLDKLATRYPNLFGQTDGNTLNSNPSAIADRLSQLFRERGPAGASPISAAQADTLERLAQSLQAMPLNERDRESAERIARSARQIKALTNHIDRQMGSWFQ